MRRGDREVTDLRNIEEIIKKCKTCHIAMVDNGLPYIVPMSFGYKFVNNRLNIYLHCAYEGRKVDILKTNPNVCFEMSLEGEPIHSSIPCNSGYYYESAIGTGNVMFVEDVSEKCMALTYIVKQQTDKEYVFTKQQSDSVCVFKVEVETLTGKRKPKEACNNFDQIKV